MKRRYRVFTVILLVSTLTGGLIGCVPTPMRVSAETATPQPPTATPLPPTATPLPPTATPLPPTATPTPDAGSTEAPVDLAGTRWTLVSYIVGGKIVAVLPNVPVTAEFAGDRVTGNASCNNYFAAYQVDGGQLTIGPVGTTRMACDEPTTEQERAYLVALGSAYAYRVEGDELTITDVDGTPVATFTTAQTLDLIGTVWEWERFEGGDGSIIDVEHPSRYTLILNPDGTYQVRADCNRSGGAYELDEAHLTLQPGPTTLAECGPDSLYDEFLSRLGHVRTYVRVAEGDKLVLNLWADAGNLIFRPVKAVHLPEVEPDLDFDVRDIALDTQGLPHAWQPAFIPATPYDESQPPGPKGLPAHIEILFGVSDPQNRKPGDPVMYLIPVNAYKEVWESAGNEALSKAIEEVTLQIVLLPQPARTAGMPALPFEQTVGYNDLAVQVDRVAVNEDSASLDGYRFVGRWAQDANPVTNGNLRYVYMGLTSDGQYLVAFFYPVTTSALPSIEEVPAEEQNRMTADHEAYMQEKAEMLNELTASDWVPNLETLDALVASLTIKGMPASGIAGRTWQWERTINPNTGEATAVQNPAAYTLVYHPDGTFEFRADCNRGSGTYAVEPGIAGSLRTELGPMTLAECGPASRSQDLVNALTAAQNFKLLSGGYEFRLVLPAAGGELVFHSISPQLFE